MMHFTQRTAETIPRYCLEFQSDVVRKLMVSDGRPSGVADDLTGNGLDV
jgi:hypothetical protein